jgi:hypothetical protein
MSYLKGKIVHLASRNIYPLNTKLASLRNYCSHDCPDRQVILSVKRKVSEQLCTDRLL